MATILVVEGYEPLRQTLRRMLESRHHRVLTAASALEAFEVWRQRGADLVILDLHMPDADGLELLLQFHTVAPERPIIATSAGDPRGGGFETLKAAPGFGAAAALAKPFRLHQVLDLVAQVLGTEPDPG
jgi:CheY-like chemotaxis protein